MTATATTTATRYFMNPYTGSVASLEEWKADFESMTAEEWGGEHFEDAELIEVVNINGEWREAE